MSTAHGHEPEYSPDMIAGMSETHISGLVCMLNTYDTDMNIKPKESPGCGCLSDDECGCEKVEEDDCPLRVTIGPVAKAFSVEEVRCMLISSLRGETLKERMLAYRFCNEVKQIMQTSLILYMLKRDDSRRRVSDSSRMASAAIEASSALLAFAARVKKRRRVQADESTSPPSSPSSE